jgi:predicted Rossmann-fold nucleotide-binding protein
VIEIDDAESLARILADPTAMSDVVFQGIDLCPHSEALLSRAMDKSVVFLGCAMTDALREHAHREGAMLFPRMEGLPFHPYRGALYTVDELYDGFDRKRPASYRECLDARVYDHWQGTGHAAPDSILETLARRLHDHAITDALEELIDGHRVVAVMGGHGMDRGPGAYAKVAQIARHLSRRGFMIATGGGPGAMEAAHVGAWFAGRKEEAMLAAIDLLAGAPRYDDPRWLSQAFEVRERWPIPDTRHPSVGIPTWLYGHEPPNAFATHVAKYFANSVREDGLLTIAKAGVIYSPGSAGTIQEVFQDACQNHYKTVGVVSPMVFLGEQYWTTDKPVYPLLMQLAKGREYAEWLSITDDVGAAVEAILRYDAR